LGKKAYAPDSLHDSEILGVAQRVHYVVDPSYPGPGHFKGEVRIALRDGRELVEVEEYNRGSFENPMTEAELWQKFDDNAGEFLAPEQRSRLANEIKRLETLPDAGVLVGLAVS